MACCSRPAAYGWQSGCGAAVSGWRRVAVSGRPWAPPLLIEPGDRFPQHPGQVRGPGVPDRLFKLDAVGPDDPPGRRLVGADAVIYRPGHLVWVSGLLLACRVAGPEPAKRRGVPGVLGHLEGGKLLGHRGA